MTARTLAMPAPLRHDMEQVDAASAKVADAEALLHMVRHASIGTIRAATAALHAAQDDEALAVAALFRTAHHTTQPDAATAS